MQKQTNDFAALSEPDCAHYCRGECDPLGATCFKGHKLHQIAEPERDAGVMLDDEDRKALGFVIAVVMTSLALVLVGAMVAQ